jgi:hypothetical protein
MMFSAALVQIAAAQALLQDYSRTQIARKPLATNALLSPPAHGTSCAFVSKARIVL